MTAHAGLGLVAGVLQFKRDFCLRGHVHFGANGADLGNQPHDPVHFGIGVRIDQVLAEFWPCRGDQRPVAAAVGQLLPQLLGDEGHDRMQQVKQLIQRPRRRRPSFGFRRFVVAFEDRLHEFQIPVAKRAPGEMIKGSRRVVEPISLQRPGHRRLGVADLADDPAVDRLPGGGGIEAVDGRAFVHLAEPRRVPELGDEIAVAFDPAFREADVAALGGKGGEREAERIGAEFIDQFQRVDDVALGFRHLLALFVAHQGMDVDRMERHLVHEMQAHHHPGDPEKDDVETGNQHVGRVIALKLGRFARPAEGGERP